MPMKETVKDLDEVIEIPFEVMRYKKHLAMRSQGK